MRFESIGFWTIEFEDRPLMVARARRQPEDHSFPRPQLVPVLPRLVAFMAVLGYGGDILKLRVKP